MKKNTHPEFKEVVFKDVSTGFQILTKSTVRSKNTIELNGKTYPLVTFDVSSSSHPFYTGKHRLMDTEGRAEKFRKKYLRNTPAGGATKASSPSNIPIPSKSKSPAPNNQSPSPSKSKSPATLKNTGPTTLKNTGSATAKNKGPTTAKSKSPATNNQSPSPLKGKSSAPSKNKTPTTNNQKNVKTP